MAVFFVQWDVACPCFRGEGRCLVHSSRSLWSLVTSIQSVAAHRALIRERGFVLILYVSLNSFGGWATAGCPRHGAEQQLERCRIRLRRAAPRVERHVKVLMEGQAKYPEVRSAEHRHRRLAQAIRRGGCRAASVRERHEQSPLPAQGAGENLERRRRVRAGE